MLVWLLLLLQACARTGISPEVSQPEIPNAWQAVDQVAPVVPGWVERQGDTRLQTLTRHALKHNFSLARQAAELEAARQQVIIAGAPLYPALNLGLDGSRQRTVFEDTSSHSSNIAAGFDFSWELDLWGKLGDAKRDALLSFKSRQMGYEQARQQLAADVSRAWYDLLEASQLIQLFEERLSNLDSNLTIIESGYRQGITQALDVYLARNEVEQERAKLAQQRQQLREAVNRLQYLLGDYPSGKLQVDSTLPEFNEPVAPGLPSELLKRRPGLVASWFELMAADARLAVAHKARFPTLLLSGSLGDSDNALNRLLEGGPLAWSLIGGLTQPLFAGGRLVAREKQALAELQQREQQYLDQLYTAFVEVENSLGQQQVLFQRYQHFLKAQENAVAAQNLAFDQYQRGLVSYTSVLESQRRAFDAQTTVVQLRNQMLQNRVSLHLALGGDFELDSGE